MSEIGAEDVELLRRCIELARVSLSVGDEPFGSVLVDGGGAILAEDRNRASGGDPTAHPELELARWAARNLSPEDRGLSTVYTSSEHCAMCAAASGWVGIGRIVFASSTPQLTQWFAELGFGAAPVAPLTVRDVAPGIDTAGPVPELAAEVRTLLRAFHGADDDE